MCFKKDSKVSLSDYKYHFLGVALVLRLILVYVAKVVDDNTNGFKYTDTDYDVFTDAATHVYNGGSPFNRHTYRYTPIAAYICLLNNVFHYVAGKIVFCILDVIMGAFMWNIIESQNENKGNTIFYVAFWIFNPLVMAISTRGSNDNIIVCLVFASVYFILKRQYWTAGFVYGFSVHFKIYPIIYCIPFYLFIDCDKKAILAGKTSLKDLIFNKNFFTYNRVVFTIVSASTFFFFTGLFYYIYGYEYLYEALLYHFERKDNRHNFSVYSYMIY